MFFSSKMLFDIECSCVRVKPKSSVLNWLLVKNINLHLE
jgi:hypothetical protein